ncbi:chorismate mutase [Vagococcus sp.]|uniref:chorismate mutase n=1 Tax=Vagococcus sp. TaxID=1933889 RepID=UPI003F96F38C
MLEKTRQEIDTIDEELVRLFEKRMMCVAEVIAIKKQNNSPILDEAREEEILKKVSAFVENPKYEEDVRELFKTLMDLSKKYQLAQINKT